MPFQFSEAHIAQFFAQGYTVFRRIIPPALIRDLRATAEKIRGLTERELVPHAHLLRLGTMDWHGVDDRAFRDYAELPALTEAVRKVLTPRHQRGTLAGPHSMALLMETAQSFTCTPWHRDWRDHVDPGIWSEHFNADYERHIMDVNYYNQSNCALYEDSALWIVPGSHFRTHALPGEWQARHACNHAELNGGSSGRAPEEQERFCQEYCHGMPGAMQVLLDAGDYCLYRANAWHLGYYLPYRKRVTIIDFAPTPEVLAYLDERVARLKRAQEQRRARPETVSAMG